MEAAEIDKELEDVETRLDQTRALYEQYFMGMERIEPQKPRQEIERRIKVLRKEQIRNTAQRFKFNVLVQRFNTLQQYWGRVVREIENGTFKRDVIRAAARFGDGALTGVAKKRAKELSKLVAAQAKRPVDDMMELGADDLIEDDDDDDDLDAPTPPKMDVPPAVAARGPGLGQADLPVIPIITPVAVPPAAMAPIASAQQPVAVAAGPADAPAAPPPAAAPARSAGLRWGSSDPSSSIRTAATDAKRRVAELAAEMRTARPQEEERAFGALDLDFDDSPGSRRAQNPPAPPPQPSHVAAVPPARASAPVQRAPAAPSSGGFGVLDIPFEPEPAAPYPAPSPSSPGSGIRMGGGRPAPGTPQRATPAPAPAPQRATPAPAASAPQRATPVPAPQPRPAAQPAAGAGGGDLAEQRLRQIYAKYVETKRSVNESTAGVTYDKLAATLRAQAEKLKSQHPSKSIDYEVVIKDGKTHLKPVLR